MDITDGVADLHIHTTASDGTCSVSDRISAARNRGIETIAITDHDIIPDDIEKRISSRGSIDIVAGVEVRADTQNTKIELLGYFIDPADETLERLLLQVREYRRDRNRRMVERLHEITDLDRSYEEIRATADGILGRPHIASVLVEDGIVGTISKAFERYIGAEGSAFVSMERMPATKVIRTIQNAGGVVSLAHPGRIRTDGVESIVESLSAEGLDAIEVPYPYDEDSTSSYAEISHEGAAALATEYNLLWTGGSDCHGPGSGKFRIGEARLCSEHFEALRTRAASRQSFN
jgi:predicted metal-dependent phosphoesterase TrpH